VSSLGAFEEDESKNHSPDRSHAYNWRGAWSPLHDSQQTLHFGAVINRTSYFNNAPVSFRVNPGGISQSGVSPLYLVDTGAIANRDHLYKGGVEFLYNYANWGLM